MSAKTPRPVDIIARAILSVCVVFIDKRCDLLLFKIDEKRFRALF